MSSAREWSEVKAAAALRDRIVAAIEDQHVSEYQGGVHPEDVMRLADAVVAELNLSVSVQYLSADRTRHHYMLAGHYFLDADDG